MKVKTRKTIPSQEVSDDKSTGSSLHSSLAAGIAAGLAFTALASLPLEVRGDEITFANGRVQSGVVTRARGEHKVDVFDPATGKIITWANTRIAGIEKAPVIIPAEEITIPEAGALVGAREHGATFRTPTTESVALEKDGEHAVAGGGSFKVSGGVSVTGEGVKLKCSESVQVARADATNVEVEAGGETTLGAGDVASVSDGSEVNLTGDAKVKATDDAGATLTYPAGTRKVGLQRGSSATLPEVGGGVKAAGNGTVKVVLQNEATSKFPAGTEFSVGGVNLPPTAAEVEYTLQAGDSATFSGPAELTLSGGARLEVVRGDATLEVPGGTTGEVLSNTNANLDGGVVVTPRVEAAFSVDEGVAGAPDAAAGRQILIPAGGFKGLVVPLQGATMLFPGGTKQVFPAGTILVTPGGGGEMPLPPLSEIEGLKGKHKLPELFTVVDGKSGATMTLTGEGVADLGEDDRVISPEKATKQNLPGNTRVKLAGEAVPETGLEIELPAGASAQLLGGVKVDAPVGAVLTPNPKPVEEPKKEKVEEPPKPAVKIKPAAPDATGAGPTLLDKVDGMLTNDAGQLTGFPNVAAATTELEGALKTNPDLQKNANAWAKLGALYGLTGCKYWGDTNTTPDENKKRVDGLACLNTALELDPKIANTTLWGQPFNAWYTGIGDTAARSGGLQGDRSKITMTVTPDGTLKVVQK
ncbi:MAG: hypothetical protein ABH834_00900 [Candidatus Altiarchaeota archaeon]